MILGPLALVGVVLFIFIGGEVRRLLWNWLLPSLFGWHEITFGQALALLVLCRILFGGLHAARAPARGSGAASPIAWRIALPSDGST